MSYDRKLIFVTVPVEKLFSPEKEKDIVFDMPKLDDYEFDSVASSEFIPDKKEALICAVYKSKKATF
jgi:hypothetical protein